VAVARRDEQFPFIARRTGDTQGSITARRNFERTVFRDPFIPAMARTGKGRPLATPLTAMPRPAESHFRWPDSNGARASIDPPRTGSGSGCMPALRRILGDPPTVGADFNAAPELIRQIEVDQAVLLGEAE
jgi:hypothetical protein